jgi:two-component system sensor histidine kinase KdpD
MDGTLIEQVLINLLENAVKHTPENTAVEVNVRKDGSWAVFEVSDNGGGISPDDLPHLFDAYAQNDRKIVDSSRGMGIGLSICMSIVKAHRGKMEAINKPDGKGAIFRFALPIVDPGENVADERYQ